MPILNNNEKHTRDVVRKIANMTGLPSGAVRAVIDGLELCVLDELREIGQKSDLNAKNQISVEVPNIGTIELSTSNYPSRMSTMVDGKSFRSKFKIADKFLVRARWAYYSGYDYLTESAMTSFKGLFRDHYKSIIENEED